MALAILASGASVQAQDGGEENLAKQSQNPLGTVVSLPFENNTYFGIGPSDSVANVLNLKPVYPVSLGDWNLINRFIAPVIYGEGQGEGQDRPTAADSGVDLGFAASSGIAQGSAFGLGDLTYQAFFSPKQPIGGWILGAGPVFVLPTATEDRWSSDKWSAGVGVVGLTMPGNWVIGMLAQNVWSVAGDSDASDVNSFLFQYFVNYNLKNGWYLSSTPVITANWEADSNQRWTVPFGGGVGRLVRFGKQPVDFKLAAYYNAEKPDFGPDWSLQFQVKLLFPK